MPPIRFNALVTNQINENAKLILQRLAIVISMSLLTMQANAQSNLINTDDVHQQVADAQTIDPIKAFIDDIEILPEPIIGLDTALNDEPDLWVRIQNGYNIPNIVSPYTVNHETWYASRPDYVKRMVERSQKYLFYIVEEVEKRGMPTEIALLPMVESAFNPQAYSRSHASGIWQFVPATGKDYGLQQNWWVDNRRDVTAATNAALNYLQKLHGMFGQWDLALAAYNAGEGTVSRAIAKNRSLGLPTDYAHLELSAEAKNYVPKLQAIKNLMTNPEQYGLQIGSIPNRPYFARVSTPKQIDAKLAAQFAEITVEEFSALNPSYNRPVITSTGEKHFLLLPVWSAERFAENIASYDKPLSTWRTYYAKRGELLHQIAEKFGIGTNQLQHANSLSSAQLNVNQPLLVPSDFSTDDATEINVAEINQHHASFRPAESKADIKADDVQKSEPKYKRTVTHKVKRGDTLSSIARKYDTSTNNLIQTNRFKNASVKIGQLIRLETWNKLNNKLYNQVAAKSKNSGQKRLKYHAKLSNKTIITRKSTKHTFKTIKRTRIR